MKIEFLEDGAPDCPLVRIYGTNPKEFEVLYREVIKLQSGRAEICAVHGLNGFQSIGSCHLTMIATNKDEGLSKPGHTPNLIWKLTQQKWLEVAKFVEPFAREMRVGTFQWLAGAEARAGLDIGHIAVLLSCSKDGHW